MPLSRRTFLRGSGAALSLPLLDAMRPKSAAAAEAQRPPVRSAFVFFPNGAIMPQWKPTRTGVKYKMPASLESWEPFRDDLLFVSGLAQNNARSLGDGAGDHARNAATYLTCAHPKKTGGADIRVGQSIDQAIAEVVGRQTRLPSLELGIEPSRHSGRCDSGYSCAYQSNISWKSDTLPTSKEIHPRFVFERLFGDRETDPKAAQRRLALRQSILDYVADDAKSLAKAVGTRDRDKLDEFYTSVREVEQRIERAAQAEPVETPIDFPKPVGSPKNAREHIRLMYDLLALSFRTDTTRVGTFMLANGSSNRTFAEIGVNQGHHQLSHHRNDEGKVELISRVDRYYAELFAHFLKTLRETPDGDGTLLDNVMVVYGSGISDGNRHQHHDLPVVLAGRGGGTVQPGRHLEYGEVKKGESRGSSKLSGLQNGETPMANLFLSMLQAMGGSAPRFGDSSGTLPGLA